MPNNQANSEGEITLGLLRAVDGNAQLTQRSLAADLGIALGLVNTYLKRCINKGYIKTSQIPSKRYVYYLTPTGFAEKSKLAAEYLHQSLSLFRQARGDYTKIFDICVANGWSRPALCGFSDLAEIAILMSGEYPVTIAGIYDSEKAGETFHGRTICGRLADIDNADAWVVTSLSHAQQVYDMLMTSVPRERVLLPNVLETVHRPSAAGGMP